MEESTTDPAVVDTGAEVAEATDAQPAVDPAIDPAVTQPAEPTTEEEPSTDENSSWLQAKGIDPSDPEAISKLAEMARNAEKKMHETTTKASQLEKSLESTQLTGPTEISPELVQTLLSEVVSLKTTQSVNSFFAANPEAKQYEDKMAEIVTERPEIGQLVKAGHLTLRDVYAMAQASSGAIEQAKADGGKEALQSVASKQQARAVPGAATSSELATAPEDDFLKGLLGK